MAGEQAIRFLTPFVQLTSCVARWLYVSEQIRKVTPTPKPQVVKQEEKEEIKLDIKEEAPNA